MNSRTNSILASVRARIEDRTDSFTEAAEMTKDEAFAKAKAAFLKATGLPKEVLEPGTHPIPVPKLFKSLWTEISVITEAHALAGNDQLIVRWSYSHPGGGSNGFSVGQVGVHDKGAGYRLNSDGKYVSVWTK